jgi:putative DNA primase/helicase
MTAREIASALGKARREGRDWRCQCPVHSGDSLTLRDGRDTLLVKCWGGCTAHQILDALRSRGLIDGVPDPEQEEARRKRTAAAAKTEAERTKRKIARARALYQRGKPAAGTPVEVYLRSRGITIPIPPVLRYLRWCPHRNGRHFPAMVAPIVNVAGEQTAIHKTFLKPDGSGKADLPKEEQRETCGPMKGAAVRLAPPRDGEILVAEGIETTLAAMQMFGLPGWAAICAPGVEALQLPSEARKIIIAADNDESGTGQHAALRAHDRWVAVGRSVRILLPPNTGEDFNDVLLPWGQ